MALLPAAACRGAGGAPPPPTTATAAATPTAPAAAQRLTVRVVARYPHDPQAFTQGLLWHDGKLFESTGLYGRSSVRRVELTSGRVEAQSPLAPSIFGEGLALVGE